MWPWGRFIIHVAAALKDTLQELTLKHSENSIIGGRDQ